MLLAYGGNKNFREFLEEYNVPINTNQEFKYKLVCVDYYRKYVYKNII